MQNYLLLTFPYFVASMVPRFNYEPTLSVYSKQSWKETDPDNRTLMECSIRCFPDSCFGFYWTMESETCTTPKALDGEAVVVGPAQNSTQPWLKSGHVKNVSRLALLDASSAMFVEYFWPPVPNSAILNIPNFPYPSDRLTVHHTFDWGILMCDVSNQRCSNWLYGSEVWVNGPSLHKRHTKWFDQNPMLMINGNFWVIGGYDAASNSSTEYLTPEGQWVLGPELPNPLGSFGVALISDWQVLIAGGARRGILQNDVRILDLVNGTWKTIAQYPVRLSKPACAGHVLLSKAAVVICVGGECRNGTCTSSTNALGTTGVYDINSGIWEFTPDWDLPVNCINPRMRLVNGRLLIVGGDFEDGQNNRILEFKEGETPVWQEIGTLPTVGDALISVESPIWFQG